MEKKTFGVTCTLIYNGYVEVKAENEEEAQRLVAEKLNNDNYPSRINEDFCFGEVTVDFADEE